jgi:hypothetical protein
MARAEDFAKWIVQNPDKRGTPEFDTVAQAFQAAREAETAQPQAEPQQPAPRTLLDRIKGLGETGATMVGGALATIPASLAAVNQMGTLAARGLTGQSTQGVETPEQAYTRVSEAMTPIPKTEAGQEYVGDVGRAFQDIPAYIPGAGQLGMVMGGAAQKALATGQAQAAAKQAAQAAQRTGQAVAAPVGRAVQAGREFVVGSKSEIPEINGLKNAIIKNLSRPQILLFIFKLFILNTKINYKNKKLQILIFVLSLHHSY